jgi:hypothetical protein
MEVWLWNSKRKDFVLCSESAGVGDNRADIRADILRC